MLKVAINALVQRSQNDQTHVIAAFTSRFLTCVCRFSSVFIANFQQVFAPWVVLLQIRLRLKERAWPILP